MWNLCIQPVWCNVQWNLKTHTHAHTHANTHVYNNSPEIPGSASSSVRALGWSTVLGLLDSNKWCVERRWELTLVKPVKCTVSPEDARRSFSATRTTLIGAGTERVRERERERGGRRSTRRLLCAQEPRCCCCYWCPGSLSAGTLFLTVTKKINY